MKLGKEEIQKLVLGLLLFFGLIYSYFDLLLGPLSKRQEAARQSITALGPEIANAKAQIEKTRQMEQNIIAAQLTARQVDAMIPEGSPVAWFPTRMTEFFKKQGIDKALTRMNGELPDKDLPGFRKLVWGVDLPKVEFASFAEAVAALENEEPLFEIAALQIDASREDVEAQHALITLNNLVKQ
jgi:hypothetical protein